LILIPHLRGVWFVSVAMVLLLTIPLVCSAATPAPGGSLELTITFHYGVVTVHGELENVVIQPNDSISMLMTIKDTVFVHGKSTVSINGTLVGMRSGSTLSGQILNLVGESCIIKCGDFKFVGKGQWSGTLNQTHGAGTFQGTVTVTESPIDEYVPVGEVAPFSGTWSADF
jgi:hypothetical protein